MQNFYVLKKWKCFLRQSLCLLWDRAWIQWVFGCRLQWSRFEPDTLLTVNLPKRLEQDDSPACRTTWESRMTVITGVNSSTEQREHLNENCEHKLFKYELCWVSSLSGKNINTWILLRKWQVYLWKVKSQVGWPNLSLTPWEKKKAYTVHA